MRRIKNIIPQNIKNLYHLGQAVLANIWYGFPSRKIKIIGVTGTNGKTTTVQMIAKILEEAGKKVAVASTINFKINGQEWVNKTKFTTLSSFQVQSFIKKAVKNGCEYVVLETSSHSLDQYRVWGIRYKTAVVTNITREHLDYHKTMESYRKAKLGLFKEAEISVVNLDMENPEDFLKLGVNEKYGYTASTSNEKFLMTNDKSISNVKIIRAENIELGIRNTEYKIQDTNLVLHLPGMFNVENALAATCVGLSEGISLEKISAALEKIKLVPGRMEYVENSRGLNVIIDYAVTPDSLEKIYRLIRQINTKKANIIAVFGSCGERDRGKRPIMGRIVSECANYVIITNEDPYCEDPESIIQEVANGVENKKEGENFWKIMDRRQAIKKALQIAKPEDFVIVTGKGAEETMAVGNKRIEWNDRRVIEEELRLEN